MENELLDNLMERAKNIKEESCRKQCALAIDMILMQSLDEASQLKQVEDMVKRYERLDKDSNDMDKQIRDMGM